MLLPTRRYTGVGIIPAHEPDLARTMTCVLAPGVILPMGTILGQVLNNTGADINNVQTITPTGTISGGTFTLAFSDGSVTTALPYNATAAQIQTALANIVGVGGVAVTGGPINTTAAVVTFQNQAGGRDYVNLVVTNNLTGTTPVLTVTRTTRGIPKGGHFVPYNSGNSDGSQTARCILEYDSAVDLFGLWANGQQQGGGDFGTKWQGGPPAWYTGSFFTSQLIGLDSNAVTNLKGRFTSGDATTLTLPNTVMKF